jgi:hypothetical protein
VLPEIYVARPSLETPMQRQTRHSIDGFQGNETMRSLPTFSRRIARSAVFSTQLFLSSGVAADQSNLPSKSDLAAITARGRMLAEYDAAVLQAYDALRPLSPTKELVTRYIARKNDKGWVVDFGRVNEARDSFLVAFVATQGSTPKEFTIQTQNPPTPEQGFDLQAAIAIETCMGDFGRTQLPYHAFALPSGSNQLYVYLLPAQTKTGVYIYGGDVRYQVSSDGLTIVEKHPMHKSVLQSANKAIPHGTKLAGGVHSHVLSEVPEDSDVFMVLARKPAVPETVGSKSHIYQIALDGTITVTK